MRKGNTFLGACYKGAQYIGELYKGSTHINSFGFPKTASGASPITLANARAKLLTFNRLSGNAQRTISIDGVEYLVPSGITLLEYASSAGATYIDLGIIPSGTDDISIRRRHKGTGSTTSSHFGCMPALSQTTPRFSFGKYSSSGVKSFCGFNITQIVGDADTEWHTDRVFYSDSHYYVQRDGETPITYTPQTQTECTLTAYLFARHGTSGVQVYDGEGTDISYVDWKDASGNSRAYFVAAKNASNVVGVYDLIAGRFLAPSAGTLTAGAELPTPSANLGVAGTGEPYVSIGGTRYPVPDGYTLLDYIKTTGTQHIDTGIQANPSCTNTTMRVCLTDTTGTKGLFGARGSTFASARSYNIFGNVSGAAGRFDNVNPSNPYVFTENTWYEIELGHNGLKGTVTVDGTLVSTGGNNMENSEVGSIYIGTFDNNGTPFATKTSAKWGIVQIWKDGANISGIFHPAKNSSNVVGMYDFVSGRFFTNAGTGTFTAGNPATMEYAVAERIARNCGCIDMGTLNWNPIGNGCLYSAITGKANGRNIYCSKYPTDQSSMASATSNMHIGGHDGNRVYFKNTSLENTRAAAQADLSGVYLYYQRTTDSEWTAPTMHTAYSSAPLRKVGSYADTLDLATGTITRRVGVKVLDGTESWAMDFGVGMFGLRTSATDKIQGSGVSSHFRYNSINRGIYAGIGDGEFAIQVQSSDAIFCKKMDITTVDDWQAYLAAQYAAGTPVTIYYPLATATTESITPIPVTPSIGTNYLESANDVAASNIEAAYISKTS